MKHITFLFAFALLIVAFGSNAAAQQAQTGKDGKVALQQQTGQNQGPRFVDADGDGICDNVNDGTRQRQHARQGTGKGLGQGNGDCTGTAQRKQLRDGSCGDGAAPAGAQRQGRRQAK
jgi:hypothetical protein